MVIGLTSMILVALGFFFKCGSSFQTVAFGAVTHLSRAPGPSTHDAAGREVQVILLDEDCLARLVAAMLALPAEVVEQFYAAWETG